MYVKRGERRRGGEGKREKKEKKRKE
jgi:hypothetical protein